MRRVSVWQYLLPVLLASLLAPVSPAGTIGLQWDPVPGASGYHVEVNGILDDIGLVTNYVFEVPDCAESQIRIKAYNDYASGEWSAPFVGYPAPSVTTTEPASLPVQFAGNVTLYGVNFVDATDVVIPDAPQIAVGQLEVTSCQSATVTVDMSQDSPSAGTTLELYLVNSEGQLWLPSVTQFVGGLLIQVQSVQRTDVQ